MELKPCPFCGSDAEMIDNGYDSFWIQCNNHECLCELACQSSREEAITAWNTRHD